MYSRHPPPQLSRSGQVRRLWAEFQLWHAAQQEQIEKQVADALRDLDAKWRSTKPRKSKKELEQQKSAARSEIEKTFDGNRVREEWDNRLSVAALRSDEWDDITEDEQKTVERILGADLDLDEPDTTTLIDHSVSPQRASSFLALPLTHDSRSSSTSDTYAIVDPHTFNTLDENSYDSWLEVRQRHRSDDEVSLDVSTASSFGWGASSGDAPAYTSWSSEISRSSTQSSQTSSPEWLAPKYLAPDPSASLLASAAKVLSASQDPVSKAAVSNDRIRPHSLRSDSSSTLLMSQPPAVAQESASDSRAKSKSSGYVGPHLTDSAEITDEEAEFEKFKLSIRIQKIREFHTEAADADIRLTLALDEARRSKKSSKEEEARLVHEHETEMLELRRRKEEERKAIVDAERRKRRAELRQRSTKDASAPVASTSKDPPPPVDTALSIPQQFLKALQGTADGSQSTNASDTPTIRQTARRQRKQSLQTDWASGNDTPTPTSRTSGWMVKQTGKPVESSGLAEAPPLKRLATAPASTLSQSQQSTSSSVDEHASKNPPAEESGLFDSTVTGGKKSKSAKSVPEPAPAPVTSTSTSTTTNNKKSKAAPAATGVETASKKVVAQTVPAAPASSKTKADASSKSKKSKMKEVVTESETEGASSSKQTLEQMPVLDPQPRAPPKADLSQAWGLYSDPATALDTTSFFGTPYVSISSTASSSTSSVNLPSTNQHSQLPDNRRVWMPPGAMDNKRPVPKRKATLDLPSQLEKSVSGQEHTSHAVLDTGRARRLSDPVSPSPRSFDFPTISAEPGPVPAPGLWRTSKGEVIQPEPAATAMPGARRTSKGEVIQPQPTTTAAPGVQKTLKEEVKQPEPATSSAPSSILKKAKNDPNPPSKSSSKKKGKKKVTIEEVKEESEEAKGTEKLPVDSRFIMEPKPVVPQAAFSQIFEYGTQSDGPLDHAQELGNDIRTSSTTLSASTKTGKRNEPEHSHAPSSNVFWTPNGDDHPRAGNLDHESISAAMWGNGPQLGKAAKVSASTDFESMGMWGVSGDPHFAKAATSTTMVQASAQFPSQEKHVRWTPSALEYEVGGSGGDTGEDLFLSALDSLEAIVRGSGDHQESEADLSLGLRLASSDGRAGVGTGMGGRKDKKGRGGGNGRERDGEEAFWQHAIASLGGRGGASASAM